MKRTLLLAILLGLLGTACAEANQASPGVERTIYMAAVEPKGGANVADEPFPATALPDGGGYGLKPPNDEGRWEVETYRFEPSTVVVNQGDIVTLEIVGINGKEHPITVEGYDVTGVVRRGEITRITFTADQAGIFRITCAAHAPTMVADLIVLNNA
jgi:hypothetical protein